jgi:hypothetical protein
MDKVNPLDLNDELLEMDLNNRLHKKRSVKKRKLLSGITKKDRMDVNKLLNKLIALNKKINNKIKNKKSCKKQPLSVTFEKSNKLKLSTKKRKARKMKEGDVAASAMPIEPSSPSVENNTPSESIPKEEKPVESTESPENTTSSESTPKEENPVESTESPENTTSSESTPKEEKSDSLFSSVSKGVESAAESVGLTSKPAGEGEVKKEGGRRQSKKGKGKKSKWV